MKILISVSYYAPHISGLTNSIKNLAEGLAQKGQHVSVLTTQHKKKLALHEVINNVSVERVPYLLKLQKGFIMPLFISSLFRQMPQNDCLLINLPQAEGIFAAVIGKMFDKKVVSVYACEISLPKGPLSFIIEKILYLSHFLTLLLSDNVVALSDDYAKHSKLLRHFSQKTIGIFPYINKPEIKKKHFDNQKKGYRIGFIGRISSEKGLEYLLEAVPMLKKQLGEFIILVAGPDAVGENMYAEKIKKLVRKYEKNVSFISILADDQLGAFYASLDVLVLPSINSTEAFGMVQVEAMYCGTPVVVSDLPGVRVPVMVTGMGEIANIKDSKDLAEKIVKVLKNKKEYVKKQKLAEEIFSSDKVISQYEALLTS